MTRQVNRLSIVLLALAGVIASGTQLQAQMVIGGFDAARGAIYNPATGSQMANYCIQVAAKFLESPMLPPTR